MYCKLFIPKLILISLVLLFLLKNLVELNLSCKEDLTASSMCKILKHLNNLKKLNLGHTLANVSVIETLIKATTQIEDLNFDNCKAMDFEQFAQLIVNAYENRLKYLSIDNVLIEDKYVLLILLNCNKLKYFQENRLLENMTFVYKNPDKFGFKPVFIIEKIDFIQNQTCLNEDMMRAMCEQVPYLKTLSLNCICQGTSVLKYLNMFENLQSLTLINTNMMSFKMENYLCNFLCLNGRVLNHLELINIPDINLFLIIRFCSNLVTLIIETCRYYYPLNVNCNDPYEDELDFDSYLAKCKLMKTLKNLKTLVIKNSCYDGSISFINVDKYVKHILLLIQKSGQSLENLKFECLRFIENEFLFECFEYLTNLKCLELNQLHNISFIFVKSLVTSRTSNVLQELKLIDCKLLTKQDQIKLNREIKRKNFNLELSYK